ncbi:MAG TPA: transporter substrate-binding domain-containing protein [Smithellaceae bacterium]|nr:transporter substrate-binding domain-containing protein [Smithellaceae bacterium]
MKKLAYFLLTISLIFFTGALSAVQAGQEKLKIYTDSFEPLNYLDNGRLTGLAAEVVQEIVKRTKTKADIKVAAWEDGYKAVMERPNTALFSMAMTPERKAMFQWVGPITVQDTNFYAKKGANTGIARLEDAKKAPKIVVVKNYASEEQLRKAGFTNLETVITEDAAIKKLLSGEAELFPSGNITMSSLLRNNGATMNDVEKVLNLSTNMGYIAFSRSTSPKLVALWQKKLDEMKTDGTFRKIYAKWLPAETPPEIIQMITEEYPPVTFMKDGKVTGFVTEIVREITRRQRIPDNIRLTSWDEAYNLALINPNVVLFSAERTEQREKLFKWVGPVGKNSSIFYAKKGSGIKMNSLEDARKVSAIGTVTSWFNEQDLKIRGFTNLVSSQRPADSVKKLMNGEVKLCVLTDITAGDIVKSAGYTMDDLEPVATLSSTYFYIAFSLGTPKETIEKFKSSLTGIKSDGTFEKIYLSYIPGADMTGLLNTKESASYYPGECSDLSKLPTKERELMKFVCNAKAVALANMKKLGKDAGLAATFKEFDRQASDPDCKSGKCGFQKGELYMYAYENGMKNGHVVKIKCLAHGANPSMIGKDFYNAGFEMRAYPEYGIEEQKDAKFFRMVSDAAYRKNGYTDGFVLFTWPNPVDGNRIWLKKGYSTKLTDTIWIGSGIYIEKAGQ